MTNYVMPAERAPLDRVWMAFPSPGYSLGDTETEHHEARSTWAAVAHAVLEFEPAPHSRPEEAVEGLKGKAREIGADAIILCQAGPDQKYAGIPPMAKVQAVAIKYIATSMPTKGNNS